MIIFVLVVAMLLVKHKSGIDYIYRRVDYINCFSLGFYMKALKTPLFITSDTCLIILRPSSDLMYAKLSANATNRSFIKMYKQHFLQTIG